MNVMKKYDDNHFDLAIVDPPYGIGADKENIGQSAGIRKDGTIRIDKTWKNRHLKKIYTPKDWDKNRPNKKYFIELERVSKHQIIWGGNYFSDMLKPNGGWVVWDKGVPDGMTLSQAELAYNTKTNNIKICKYLWAGYKKCEQVERIHPTQKPIKLYEWLLHNYAEKGQKILDTHLGSGSIAVAAHYFGVDLVGVEIDKEYYDKAKERVDELTKQTTMF